MSCFANVKRFTTVAADAGIPAQASRSAYLNTTAAYRQWLRETTRDTYRSVSTRADVTSLQEWTAWKFLGYAPQPKPRTTEQELTVLLKTGAIVGVKGTAMAARLAIHAWRDRW